MVLVEHRKPTGGQDNVHAVVVDKSVDGQISASYQHCARPAGGAGDLVVRPSYVGLCGTDVEQLHGQMPTTFKINYPHTLGHEWSGVVEEVGAETIGFEVGDRVLGHGHLGGNDWFGVTHNGAMSEVFTVPAEMCFHVPENVSMKTAAVIEPFACVLQAVKKIGGICPSDTVHVHGLGAIGLMAVIQAVSAGAHVVAFDPSPLRRRMAEDLGASHTSAPFATTNLHADSVAEGQFGLADLVIEASGAPSAQAAAIMSADQDARVLLMGVSAPRATPTFLGLVQQRNLIITSSTGAPKEIWPAAIRFIARAQVDLEPIVSSVMSFAEVNNAIDRAQEPGLEVKILLEP